MDTQHRHELKENDLAEFLENFGEWWNKHGTVAMLILLFLVGGFLGYRLLRARATDQREAAWRDLANTTKPGIFRTVAEMSDDPVVRAVAYLRGADLLVSETSQQAYGDSDSADLKAQQQRNLDEAEDLYRKVLEVADAEQISDLFRLNAWLGLASVYEDRRSFDKAAELYQKVQEQAGPANPALAANAKARTAMLGKLAIPVVFSPPLPPPPADTPPSPSTNEPVPEPDVLSDIPANAVSP